MSQTQEGDYDFHPLNVIQPEKWNNIPQCLMDSFRLVITEIKASELKVKFVQDKLLETQKRIEKQIKSVEKMVGTLENSLLETITQQKDATQKSIKSLTFEVSLVSERSSENQHDVMVLQRKHDELDKNVNHNYKLKSEYNEEYKKLSADLFLQVEIAQQHLKEHIAQKFAEFLDIPGLVGPGRKYIEGKALLKDLYYNYDSKASLLNDISDNRDEYFKGVCGKYVDEMNLPSKIKTLLRADLKPEIMKETIARVDEKVKLTSDEIQQSLQENITTLREENKKKLHTQDEKIKVLDKQYKEGFSKVEKNMNSVSHDTESQIKSLQKKTRSKFEEISSKIEALTHAAGQQSFTMSPERSPEKSFEVSPEREREPSSELNKARSIARVSSKYDEFDENTPAVKINHVGSDLSENKNERRSILKRDSTMSKKESVASKKESNKASSELLKEPKMSVFQSSKDSISSHKESIREQDDQIKIETQNEAPIKIEGNDEVSFRNESNSSDTTSKKGEEEEESEKSQNEYGMDNEQSENSNDQLYNSQEQISFATGDKRRQNSFFYKKPTVDQGSLDMSSKTSFLNPLKANAETQTANENILSAISGFDITKMEPYTLEFLKVLENELSNIRSNIKETKEELNLHLNYHYYNDRNNDQQKDFYEKSMSKEVSPMTFDNVLSDLQETNEKKGRPKSSGIHSKVKLSPMLLLRMISRRRELGNKIKKINELSMDAKTNPDPVISVKSHSFDARLSPPSRSPDRHLTTPIQGNNTIREAQETFEQDERMSHKKVLQQNLLAQLTSYPPSKKNKNEDTSDLQLYEEKKPNSPEFSPSVNLPSILKKPLATKKTEITFDPSKNKEEPIHPKPHKPRSFDKKPITQTEIKKKIDFLT